MNKNYSLEDITFIAKELISNTKHKVLLFYGDMGVGKTTLIKEICKTIGSDDIISSPTFSLVNEYHTNTSEIIYHFDFYRIENDEEALDIGIEEYFSSGHWCLIEWPENIKNLLPLNASEVIINLTDNNFRNIQLK
ncbi:tRNA (adenosine(37)-N6)-threonylcarbamoyltransferase complex ATPase subunit type 1 TsaE [Tenacibaculum agarivorans]|uniref:tRNA (adenosine(37)-N6)-threonylcarbamoyltransferase complex ATPase subunit type 1 TsaE n=1 Tax=Tenacibaculum agarivorans TaxID=1908389 RepID=UPI00094BB238|nr:tRNA (adenosine(37)-N6)-threonylcarbamoyltransferase complex ATPase subunit type 1 TsaE [Tenacibaculum agarivorans]